MTNKLIQKISIASVIALMGTGLTAMTSFANGGDCEVNTYTDVAGDSDTRTLRYCLENVTTGGTITFDTTDSETITIGTPLTLEKADVTIEGPEFTGDAPLITIVPNSDGFGILEISIDSAFDSTLQVTTIKNLKFLNGRPASERAGAIRTGVSVNSSRSDLNIFNSHFVGNHSGPSGGAIYADDVEISGSLFENNRSNDSSGGALSVDNLTILNGTVFKSNYADSDGGAIEAEDIFIYDSEFDANKAENYGGAIYADGDVTVERSTFISNTAVRDSSGGGGGAIFFLGSFDDENRYSLTIADNSHFENNQGYRGGAIANRGPVDISDSTFKSNHSYDDGGAIYLEDDAEDVEISNSKFIQNSADDDAGAIKAGDNVKVENNFFDRNTAQDNGGAIDLGDGTEVIGNYFFGNTSVDKGGAIEIGKDANVVENSFVGNEADDDGGAIVADADLKISRSYFRGNKAGALGGNGEGGAIQAESTNIENSTFIENTASKHGGAVQIDLLDSYVVYSTFLNNSADGSGDSVAVQDGDGDNPQVSLLANLFLSQGGDAQLIADATSDFIDYGGNVSTSVESVLTNETSNVEIDYAALGVGSPADASLSLRPLIPFNSLETTSAEVTADLANAYETGTSKTLPTVDQVGTTRVGSFFPGAEFVTFTEASDSPFSAPAPFAGPIVTSVDGSSLNSPVSVSSGKEVTITGDRLNLVSKVMIEEQEASISDKDSDELVVSLPENLTAGTYDLLIEGSFGKVTYTQGLTVSSEDPAIESYGELNAWTKRISETEAKVYLKFPQVGNRIEIDHQTGGSGEYSPVVTRTVTTTTDEFLTVNEVGTYFVRTIDLEDINRIRVIVDGEKLVQVIYK